MAQRPDPSTPASFYTSVQSLCDDSDAFALKIAGLQQTVANAQQAIAAEGQARAQAVSGEAGARVDGLALEQRARDAAISSAVQSIRSDFNALSDSLRKALNAETSARTEADQSEQEARTRSATAQGDALAKAVAALEAKLAQKASTDDLAGSENAQAKALSDALANVAAITDAIAATVAAQRLEFVAPMGRPGDTPLRYTFVPAAAALVGPRALLPLVPASLLAAGDSGPVVRIAGAGILAARWACPLEPGRLYRSRYVVQRRSNPADPTGDAVVCGVVYLDQSLRVLGAVVPVRAYPALITANGRQESEALISRSVGLGAAFQAPPSARFALPVVALYGPDAVTDVEVLSIEDVTGAFVLAPPIVDFEARLAALEAANLSARMQVLESEAGTPSKLTFGSKGNAASADIPDSVQVVELLGRQFAGDGGAGMYGRTTAAVPDGADSFTSGGAVFVRVPMAVDLAASIIDSGFEAFVAGLPRDPPSGSGKRWANRGLTPAVTP